MNWWESGLIAAIGGLIGGGFAVMATMITQRGESQRASEAQRIRIGESRAVRLENSYASVLKGLYIFQEIHRASQFPEKVTKSELGSFLDRIKTAQREFGDGMHLSMLEPESEDVLDAFLDFCSSGRSLCESLSNFLESKSSELLGVINAERATFQTQYIRVFMMIRAQLATLRGVPTIGL